MEKDDAQKAEDLLLSNGYEDLTYLTGPAYADASIGVSSDDQVVYDYNKMVECLVRQDGMTYDEAAEFIDFNTVGSLFYMGDGHPVIMYPVERFTDESDSAQLSD